MRILFIASELTPLVKVGGLGDVIGSLPLALRKIGFEVAIIIPKYDVLNVASYGFKKIAHQVFLHFGKRKECVNIWRSVTALKGVPVYCLENTSYLSKGGVYFEKSAFAGSFKELARFLFFSLAVVKALPYLNFTPDIFHCHDWHAAFVPIFLKIYNPQAKIKTMLTIHNLANQGKWEAKKILKFLNLNGKELPSFSAEHRHGDMSILEQGILNANCLTTVSPSYAQEILSPEYGEGLEETLKMRQDDLYGILNGIDINRFNPATDQDIKVRYTVKTLKNRAENKTDLLNFLGMPLNEGPVLGFIGRLTDQKGIDLIVSLADELVARHLKLIILGSGTAGNEAMVQTMAKKYPESVFIKLGFDAPLAQKIYAGTDLMLLPSRFEPCGLVQILAMRYGAVPIVRATGGLKDTVEDGRTGFVFKPYKAEAFLKAISRSIQYFQNPLSWRRIIRNGMKQNFSWDKSAKQYARLYKGC